jgi:hypothetical protein
LCSFLHEKLDETAKVLVKIRDFLSLRTQKCILSLSLCSCTLSKIGCFFASVFFWPIFTDFHQFFALSVEFYDFSSNFTNFQLGRMHATPLFLTSEDARWREESNGTIASPRSYSCGEKTRLQVSKSRSRLRNFSLDPQKSILTITPHPFICFSN